MSYQELGPSSEVTTSIPEPLPTAIAETAWGTLTTMEFSLSLLVIVLGIVLFILEYRLLIRGSASADDALRVLGITLILVGTLFVISGGLSSQQIAPALGLFGTVAGYLLGKHSINKDSSQ